MLQGGNENNHMEKKIVNVYKGVFQMEGAPTAKQREQKRTDTRDREQCLVFKLKSLSKVQGPTCVCGRRLQKPDRRTLYWVGQNEATLFLKP